MLLLPSLSLCLWRIELGKAHLQDQESALRTRPGILKNETLTVSLSWKFCVLANCRLQPCESPGTRLKIHLVTLFVVTRKDFPNSSWNGQCSSDDPRNHAQKTIFGIMNHGFQQLQRPCLKAFLKFLSSAKHVGTDHANSSHIYIIFIRQIIFHERIIIL